MDRDIKEIVYLLRSSKTNVVVIEDLDRYDNISVFTKLRELNFLLNKHSLTSGDVSPVRFIYMLRDGLFVSKNRTKFFDLIIPIVPIVDSKNSEDKLLEKLKHVKKPPDTKLLSKISLYIDDMRLLKNIINEYIIYGNVISMEELDLSYDKLFSLIVLKNVFPREFDFLQEDKGYILNVFKGIGELKDRCKTKLQEEAEEIRREVDFLSDRAENNKFEIMAQKIPSNISSYNHQGKWSDILKEYSNKPNEIFRTMYVDSNGHGKPEEDTYSRFIEKYNLIDDNEEELFKKYGENKKECIANLLNRKSNIEIEIQNLNIRTIQQLLLILSSEEREDVFQEGIEGITKNHYFPLIKFLILQGLIDETYWYYKSCFYSGMLGKNDRIFIKNLLEAKEQDVFFEIENPKEVINRLDKEDYSRFNILNKKLMEACLFNKNNDAVLMITSSADANNNYDDLTKIIDVFSLEITEKYVGVLLQNNTDNLVKLLDLSEGKYIVAFQNILISIWINADIDFDTLQMFSSYLERNANIIALIDKKNWQPFIENVNGTNIKFEELRESEIDIDRLKEIEKIQAYKLDVQNVVFIADKLLGKKIVYGNLLNEIYNSETLEATKEYVEDNYVSFIEQYIENNENDDNYTNAEGIIVKILTSDISIEHKVKYVSKNETVITKVQQLENIPECDDIFSCLLKKDKIECNKENISLYWNMIETYSADFRDYMDRNINNENAENILANNQSLCNTFINDAHVSNKLFGFVLKFANEKVEEIETELSAERVHSLIERELFSVTDINIGTLLSNSYNEEIVLLATFGDQNHEDIVITKLINNGLEDELVYMLINSAISDDNAIKLADHIGDGILAANINPEKKTIIRNIISRPLSDVNVEYICQNFELFELKTDFIISLESQNKLIELGNETTCENVILYALKSQSISINTKIQIIINQINSSPDVGELDQYIKAVKEIADIANVWNNRYPMIDNEHKDKISQVLIDAGYIKKRKDGRIMLSKSRKGFK